MRAGGDETDRGLRWLGGRFKSVAVGRAVIGGAAVGIGVGEPRFDIVEKRFGIDGGVVSLADERDTAEAVGVRIGDNNGISAVDGRLGAVFAAILIKGVRIEEPGARQYRAAIEGELAAVDKRIVHTPPLSATVKTPLCWRARRGQS